VRSEEGRPACLLEDVAARQAQEELDCVGSPRGQGGPSIGVAGRARISIVSALPVSRFLQNSTPSLILHYANLSTYSECLI
jgi:hypothetical protein